MKKNGKYPGRYFWVFLYLIWSCTWLTAQTYFFDRDEVVFEFDDRVYIKAAQEGSADKLDFADLKIQEVLVTGTMEAWSKEDWSMKKVGKHRFQLRKPIEKFNDPFSTEFKFLVNGKYWIEALPGLAKEKVLSNDFWEETFDLTFNVVDPNPEGNTLFQLQGFENAREVILAGSFNNWNEHYLKMQRVPGGWEVRIDLTPGRYEYKFIADGEWLHDPANPVKVRNEHNTFNSVLQVKKAVTFKLDGFPAAERVILAGSFNDWKEQDIRMSRSEGHWQVTLHLTGGKHYYKFIVDGNWMIDPDNPIKEGDGRGNTNSVLIVR
jgi:hypothetical protein